MASNPAPSPSRKKKYTPLHPWEEKRLITDIEEAGGFRAFDFLQTCNKDPRTYGPSGSDLRYSFQQHKNLLKKRRADSYLKLVESYGIIPSRDAVQFAAIQAAQNHRQGVPSTDTTAPNSDSGMMSNNNDDEDSSLPLDGARDAGGSFSSALGSLPMPAVIDTPSGTGINFQKGWQVESQPYSSPPSPQQQFQSFAGLCAVEDCREGPP